MRITRFECSVLDNTNMNRKVLFSHKWTRGTDIVWSMWSKIFANNPSMPFSINDFIACVECCKENGNVQMDDENGYTLMIRRWSYNRKG